MTRRNDWLLGQLPMGMLDDELFVRFASIFQEVATSLVEGADNVPNVVDATVAPVPALSWLASWLGITWIEPSLPDEVQRRLVRECGKALAWRGTRHGLEILLRAVTGADVVVEESGSMRRGAAPGTPAPAPTVRVQVQSTGWMSDDDFVELVTDEVPANVRCEIVVEGRTIGSRLEEVAV
ncbi:MAG TPA: phage tail protein [Acidimicrobiales bacterium]|nr:phage tail protein [Acidimicrobiales bacterium]